ncbi:MAG: hypothetical protein ACRCT1_00410 [Microcoleaceae cyanobacterium]
MSQTTMRRDNHNAIASISFSFLSVRVLFYTLYLVFMRIFRQNIGKTLLLIV